MFTAARQIVHSLGAKQGCIHRPAIIAAVLLVGISRAVDAYELVREADRVRPPHASRVVTSIVRDATLPAETCGLVSPCGSAAVPATAGPRSVVFYVQGNGWWPDYEVACSYTAPVTSCSADRTMLTISPGYAETVTVTYTSASSVDTGTVRLASWPTYDPTDRSEGYYRVSPHLAYWVNTTPDSLSPEPPERTTTVQTFTIRKWSDGAFNALYDVSVSCSGTTTNCRLSQDTVRLSPSWEWPVHVTYDVGAAGTSGRVSIRVTSRDEPVVKDSAWLNVQAGASVFTCVNEGISPCDGQRSHWSASGEFAVPFSDLTYPPETENYACSFTAPVQSCIAQISALDGSLSIRYTIGGDAAVGHLILTGTGLPEFGWGTRRGRYEIAFMSNLAANTTAINNENQDAGLCAASCFAATYSQSTVPYFSMDTPRQVTLVYHGDRSSLRPFVHVDASPTVGAPTAQEYRLQAKVNGAFVTFMNGEQTLRFAGSSSQVRLGGQFDAGTYGTGAHPLEIITTALYSGGGNETKTTATKLLVTDERTSHIARGWAIAGLQRVYPVAGAVVIKDGDGSAAYFANNCGTGCYTSPAGDFSRVTSSGAGYVRAWPDSTKATFNTAGQLTKVADRFGNSTDFEYDGSGRLIKIYDPFRTYNGGASRSYIALGYGAYGLSQIQEPGPDGSPTGGRLTYFTVNSDSTLRVFKDPDGDSTVFGYDGTRRLATITDRRGGLTTYNYDPTSGKLASVDLPTVTLWDGSTARPRTTYSPWQAVSVPTGSTAGVPFTPVATANVAGASTDPLGRQATFTTDRWGQVLRIDEPLGRTTTITRTGIHPWTIQRPTGAVDYATFAGALLTKVTAAGQTPHNVRYGAWAQPDSIWGAGRVAMRAFLGPNGRVDSVRIAGVDSLKAKYFYDSRGRVDSLVDAGGHVTKYHYDPLFGNRDSTLAPGSRFTKVTFDGYGRVQTQKSNDEPQRQVVYDAINRVREVHDGVNPLPTKYKYDQLYLTRVEDPKQQVFRFDNNALGWVIRKYDPADTAARYDTFGYDSAGNLRTWTNRRGQQVSYTYDVLNRLRSKAGTNTTTDSMAYSADGLRIVSWNAVSRDSVFLKPSGWVDSVVTRIAGRRFRRLYRPNDIQQLDAVEFANDAGITFANRRFGWNRTTGALDTAFVNGQTTRFTRNREILPVQTTWPSLSRTHQWTSIHRPGEESFSDAGVNTALFRRYGYDSRSNLRDRIRWDGANFRTQQAGYDGLRRLGNQGNNLYPPSQCLWDVANGYLCPLTFQQTVTYDAGGNRTDVANAAYATGNRVLSFGVYTYLHDLDGNVIEKYNASTGEKKEFEWSADGLLTRVLVNGVERVRYDYNPSGLLIRRWTNGTLDRHFLWDQGHLLAELDGTATQRIGEYAYLPGADEPLALITGAQAIAAVRYTVQDEVGNVIGLMNGAAIDQQVAYDDWGVATVTGSADNRLLFKALLWESNYTGMYYVRARWYDPELGRFVSEDPCGLSDGTNLYAFSSSDAINVSDPSGCLSLKKIFRGVKKLIRKVGDWAPVLGLGAMTIAGWAGGMSLGTAFLGAFEATAASAAGSAVAAGLESMVSGRSFSSVFQRNFNNAGWAFAAGSFFSTFGGGVAKGGLGSKGLFQGYIRVRRPVFGFLGRAVAIGPAAIYTEALDNPLGALTGATLGAHEFGHTLQFILVNSQLGMFGNPWVSYSALGAVDFVGQLFRIRPLQFWGDMATALGSEWVR